MKKKSYIAGIICTTIIICMAGVLLYRNIFAIERSNAYEGLNTILLEFPALFGFLKSRGIFMCTRKEADAPIVIT